MNILIEIKRIIHDCLTGIDGISYDPARIYLALGVNAFFGLSFYQVYEGKAVDLMQWAMAFGTLLVAGGVGVAVKAKTEPQQ